MELDFDKYCVVDGSPTTVLPAPQRSSNRKSSRKPKNGNEKPNLKKDFAEISFSRYRSASCRDVRSRRANQDEELKRGSVYQSSIDRKLLKNTDSTLGRKKIEFSQGSDPTIPLGIIDSLCSSDEDSSVMERNRFSVMSLSEQSTTSVRKKHMDFRARDSKNPIPGRIVSSNVSAVSHSVPDPMFLSESVIPPVNDGNSPRERDPAINLHKSLSAKLSLHHSPVHSESESSIAGSPKARFSPMRKMFDKSKSTRSPLSFPHRNGTEAKNEVDLFDKSRHVQYNSQCEKKENHDSILQCSPAHLHGILTLENRDGTQHFEFSVKSPEDFYIAKAWKVENTLSWIYTFHSLYPRRKSNAGGWGFKESSKESSMIGQMQVSCYLCTELKDSGVFHDSMVTEFVLYDISHSRKSTSSRENSICSQDIGNEISAKTKSKSQYKHSHSELSGFHPLAAAELHPDLETAAIVMQVPFEKRESLKFKSGPPNFLDLCKLEKEKEGIFDISSPGKMHVVIPAGSHSLPSTESRGPSPLLDRWRLGGGCDCGGWDMACPLNVIYNPTIKISAGQPLMDNQNPSELLVQGRKDNVPAFAMRIIEEGRYAVDFHAQLSSLQAFSICVSILHAAEASTAVDQERSKQMLQSDSLRVFAEDEIKSMIDAITEEDRLKANNKKMEEVLPSFVINPPFSPIARV